MVEMKKEENVHVKMLTFPSVRARMDVQQRGTRGRELEPGPRGPSGP